MTIDEMMDAINTVATQAEMLDKDKMLCFTLKDGYYKWLLIDRKANEVDGTVVKIGPLYEDDSKNTVCRKQEGENWAYYLMDALIIQFHAFNYVAQMGR